MCTWRNYSESLSSTSWEHLRNYICFERFQFVAAKYEINVWKIKIMFINRWKNTKLNYTNWICFRGFMICLPDTTFYSDKKWASFATPTKQNHWSWENCVIFLDIFPPSPGKNRLFRSKFLHCCLCFILLSFGNLWRITVCATLSRSELSISFLPHFWGGKTGSGTVWAETAFYVKVSNRSFCCFIWSNFNF